MWHTISETHFPSFHFLFLISFLLFPIIHANILATQQTFSKCSIINWTMQTWSCLDSVRGFSPFCNFYNNSFKQAVQCRLSVLKSLNTVNIWIWMFTPSTISSVLPKVEEVVCYCLYIWCSQWQVHFYCPCPWPMESFIVPQRGVQ